MDNFTAVAIAEGFWAAESQDEVIEAWQHLINTGLCWKLQGSFGRMAQRLIDEGVCSEATP
jgi:hypothetical protein